MKDEHPALAPPTAPARPMTHRISALLVAATTCLVSPAFGRELCKQKDEIDRGYNCALPFDSTGQALIYSQRMIGKVTWATAAPDEYGRYEFVVTWGPFQLRGSSWVKAIVGQPATVIVRSVLHAGQIRPR